MTTTGLRFLLLFFMCNDHHGSNNYCQGVFLVVIGPPHTDPGCSKVSADLATPRLWCDLLGTCSIQLQSGRQGTGSIQLRYGQLYRDLFQSTGYLVHAAVVLSARNLLHQEFVWS